MSTSPQRLRSYATDPVVVTFLVALVARLVLIATHPDPWQFDAYQRWASREQLWVQVWLPATQVVVWTVAKVGGGMGVLRVVMALIAAATCAMGAALARREGGGPAAWLFAAFGVFGPYLVWSVVPYQESTLLFVVFGSLLLTRKNTLLADVLMGALAFCRYEGWPLLLVYIVLERRWSALRCLWGVGVYGLLDALGQNTPYAASPDSFEDWEGLENKLNPRNAKRLFKALWFESAAATLPWLVGLGVVLLPRRWPWSRTTWLLLIGFGGQLAATVGWMFSLGIVFSRMMVIPTMLLAVVVLGAVGRVWPGLPGWAQKGGVTFLLGCMAWSLQWTVPDVHRMYRTMGPDIELVRIIEQCPGDTWAISPRKHPGPRRRHDGCEVVQGLTNLRAGIEFDCVPWEWGGPEASVRATWVRRDRAYSIERVSGDSAESCPH